MVLKDAKSEIHLFILWQNARYKELEIIEDMVKHFTMLKQYAITWTPELVSSNFTRFYGVNLPANSSKEKECGTGEFLLCIVLDENPVYAERMTSRGPEIVNVNLFDAKTRYREWTGYGHKIHGTNNEKETNHDLTLLIGKNVEDFVRINNDPNRETLHRDIEGAKRWKTIEQLFYVLNSTVPYVVLRGENNLLPQSHSDYEDTDILTTEYDNLWWIVNGTARYDHVRPKSVVNIGSEIYLLDIWDSKKKYYDPVWLQSMFENAVLNSQFRILDDENNFYCLLYHCLTNKGYIDEKYSKIMQAYKVQFHVDEDDWAKVLVNWLAEHHYDIVEHTDTSNPFNISNPIINQYALRHGKCLRIVINSSIDKITEEPILWISRVYKNDISYIKSGTPWLIDNERNILSIIGDGIKFPKVMSSGEEGGEHLLEISAMPGDEIFDNKWKLHVSQIRSYAVQLLYLIEVLYRHDIIHRDIQPENILIARNGQLSLIDFGWAMNFRTDAHVPSPRKLGMPYAPDQGFSDFYNIARIFELRWSKMPYVRRFSEILKKIDWEHYPNSDFVLSQLEKAHLAMRKRYYFMDYIEFLMGKYRVRKYFGHPRRLWKRFEPNFIKMWSISSKLIHKIIRKVKRCLKFHS